MFNSAKAFFDAAVSNFFDYETETATVFNEDYLIQLAMNWDYDLTFVDLSEMVKHFNSLLEPDLDAPF